MPATRRAAIRGGSVGKSPAVRCSREQLRPTCGTRGAAESQDLIQSVHCGDTFLVLMRELSFTTCSLVAAVSLLACGHSPATTTSTTTGASGTGGASSTGAGGAGGGGSGPWRSALYPEAWTPASSDAEGRFLHDFSYAGYHHGEADPGAPAAAKVLDVAAQYGADPLGKVDATAAAQKALDDAEAMGGAVVFFPRGSIASTGSSPPTARASSFAARAPTRPGSISRRARGSATARTSSSRARRWSISRSL